jgi:alpha-glucosidase
VSGTGRTATLRPAADGSAAAWWSDAVIYQIYPRSFADSDGDGVGDLAGVAAHLDELSELGVDAVWLSPFYRSPQDDGGYDVADYRDVDPLFGTLADAEALIASAHDRGLRMIVDLVPNHTSDEHPWFVAARQAEPGGPARDRYVFRDGRGPDGHLPPNDWESEFGGPAWSRISGPDGEPGQWYLHLFSPRQPDLNWECADVRAEFESILRFWLDRGVDGFRVDVAHGLVKAEGLPDWPYERDRLVTYGGAKPPLPYYDQDGVHEVYRSWRRLLAGYEPPRILVAEAYVGPPDRLARYVRDDEMHQAFNFEFLVTGWDAAALRDVITRTEAAFEPVGAQPTWVLSNHDVVRHPSRYGMPAGYPIERGLQTGGPEPDELLGLRRGRAATLLMLALPGGAYLYQGEELGLPEHGQIPDELRQDPALRRGGTHAGARDGCRVPIPWRADAPSYGFGPGPASWLPQPRSWARYARDAQVGVVGSTYEMYRQALSLRREHALGNGRLDWRELGERALGFVNGDILVVANIDGPPARLPAGYRPLLSSGPAEVGDVVATDTTVWAVAVPGGRG